MSTKYEIYIGLKDKERYEEIFTIEDFIKVLSAHCAETKIGFSLVTQLGGYAHSFGYATETSLRITLFGITEQEVKNLAEGLKKLVNTDAVLIASEECEYYYQ